MLKKIKILLVDDHPLVRIGLKTELHKIHDFAVTGEAKTGREAVKKCCILKPDIILLDISLPDMNGLEVANILLRKCPKSKIIALTMYNYENYVTEIMKLGAKGYVLKDSPPEELVAAIYKVMQGKKYFDKIIRNQKKEKSEKHIPGFKVLSRRETEILKNLANGLNNKLIADKFFISIRTVESHRDSIKKKLNIKSIAELTKYALSNGILD